MKTILSIFIVVFSFGNTFCEIVEAQPEHVGIRAQWAGNGCPQGSEGHVEISDDNQIIKLKSPTLEVILRESTGSRFERKICNVILTLEHPDGWSFSPSELKLRYSNKMTKQIVGKIQTKYFYQGGDQTIINENKFVGPSQSTNSALSIKLDQSWSPCSLERPLIFGISASLRGQSTSVNYLKVEKEKSIHINWKRC